MARRSDQSGGGFPTSERDGEEGMKDAFCKREREDVERGSVRASESEGGEVASPTFLPQRNYFTSREREREEIFSSSPLTCTNTHRKEKLKEIAQQIPVT